MTTEATKIEGQAGAVQPVATSQIDWTALDANWQKQREVAAAARKLERVALLGVLRSRDIVVVEARYDGYGDSGNVGEIDFSPEDVVLGDLDSRLSDFIWGMAYGRHPGFEINDGGEGTFTWDVSEDRIDIAHADFYTERNEYFHEDL